MTATAQVKKKAPSPKQVCTTCRHPRPFHTDSKACQAFACKCLKFRATVAKSAGPSQSGPLGADQPPVKPPPPEPPKNLAEALKQGLEGLEADLLNPKKGHREVGMKYKAFTSDTSVRRWRIKHGVKLDDGSVRVD